MHKWTIRKLIGMVRRLKRERNMWRESYFFAQQANVRQFALLKDIMKKYCEVCNSADDCQQAPLTGYPIPRECAMWFEGGENNESGSADPGHGNAG